MKTMDMREFRSTIREAVRRERDEDMNWSWRIAAVNKGKASIAWSYLTEYLSEREYFEVRVESDEEVGTVVEAKSPDGFKVIRFIGDGRWDDFKTVEEGIASAIHGIALHAHAVY